MHEIAATGASGLALDVTGVWIMDSHLCHVLSNLAESARLMGTPTVICGITPEIAITLETMGARFRRTQTALSLEEALDTLGVHSRQLEIAVKLEQIALKDDYFISHKLYPNVDFYSGIIYRALGIPKSMFTVMFAIARTVGWVTHWREMVSDPETRIGRPRQLYVGRGKRDYVPVSKR